MAHIVAMQMVQRDGLSRSIQIDSAGTHAYKGQPRPDARAKTALQRRGYVVGKSSSRRVEVKDFERFDLMLAMDRSNLRALQTICPAEHFHKLRLFMEAVNGAVTDEVPDPYYGNAEGFERVLDLCEAGVAVWLQRLSQP